MTRTYEVERQVGQLQKGDIVAGLGSRMRGPVVGVEQYRGKVEAHKGTTAIVVKDDGPGFQTDIFPSDTPCTVECLA